MNNLRAADIEVKELKYLSQRLFYDKGCDDPF